MPLYVFRCDECGRVREELYSIYECDEAKVLCSHCEGKHMKKMTTSFSFNLKGSGFHVNDYGKSGPKTK